MAVRVGGARSHNWSRCGEAMECAGLKLEEIAEEPGRVEIERRRVAGEGGGV